MHPFLFYFGVPSGAQLPPSHTRTAIRTQHQKHCKVRTSNWAPRKALHRTKHKDRLAFPFQIIGGKEPISQKNAQMSCLKNA